MIFQSFVQTERHRFSKWIVLKWRLKMNKLFVLGLCLLLISTIGVIHEREVGEMEEQKQVYLGPVPLGSDLEHFRKTGETVKIKEVEE